MDDHEVAGPLAVHLDDSVGQGGDQRRLVAGEACLGHAGRQVWHSRSLRLLSATQEMTTARAVRSMLLLMPRLVGRAKRLPIPDALRGLDLAPRHLALLAYLQYEGPLTVSELADRLEVAPTTVSLMVATCPAGGS